MQSAFAARYKTKIFSFPGHAEKKRAQIRNIPGSAATEKGIALAIDNIEDIRPETGRAMVDSFGSRANALPIHKDHARLVRRMAGTPPGADFIARAGTEFAHVHLQDVDGHADRNRAPGKGEIDWTAVFCARMMCKSEPYLVLELPNNADSGREYHHERGQGDDRACVEVPCQFPSTR